MKVPKGDGQHNFFSFEVIGVTDNDQLTRVWADGVNRLKLPPVLALNPSTPQNQIPNMMMLGCWWSDEVDESFVDWMNMEMLDNYLQLNPSLTFYNFLNTPLL